MKKRQHMRSGLFAGLLLSLALPLSMHAHPAGPKALKQDTSSEESGILLRSVRLDPSAPMPGKAAAFYEQLAADRPAYFIVHASASPARLRHALDEAGLRRETYLPNKAFLIRATKKELQQFERAMSKWVDYSVPYLPEWKSAPEVRALQPSSQEVNILLHFFKNAELNALRSRLSRMGLEIRGEGGRRFHRMGFRLSAAHLVSIRDELARLPGLFWIELRGNVRLFNNEAVPIVHSGTLDTSDFSMFDRGLYGIGQVVGYIDTGADYDSCFFRDPEGDLPALNLDGETSVNLDARKIIAYDFLWSSDDPSDPGAYDDHGHGTHVGGNIGGDNPASPLEHDDVDGVAPGAQFVVQDGGFRVDDCADLPALGCPVVDLEPFFAQAYAQGARVHTNSWGDNENSDAQNNYSAGSEDVDAFMHSHPDFLLLFAAGNSGPDAGTVGSPSTAKNALSIGGTQNGDDADALIGFSSRGPTTDGRFKPDLLAPASNGSAGSDYDINTENCGTNYGSGTSYASPLVAGAAALVREYFESGYYPTGEATPSDARAPSAALVKAVLINSGVNLTKTRPFPTFDQGWGRVGLETALAFTGDAENLLIEDGGTAFLSAADTPFRISVNVRDTSIPLKVTLVWTDPPSTPAAALNLVNDLDLSVRDGRRTYLGNVFRFGRSIPGGNPDTLNNVEQVLLEAPRAGQYEITVTPRSIPEGPQDFALVIRGGIE